MSDRDNFGRPKSDPHYGIDPMKGSQGEPTNPLLFMSPVQRLELRVAELTDTVLALSRNLAEFRLQFDRTREVNQLWDGS